MAGRSVDVNDLIEDAEPPEIHGRTSPQTPSNRGVTSPDIVPETAKEVEPATSRTNLYNRLGERSLDKGKCFDAAIVSASADDDLALKIVEDMNQLSLADGTALDVKFWKDECFGPNIVQRPRKIASKCVVVFILHTRNTTNDDAVEFTSDEAIAQIRIHKRQDYIRSLRTDNRLEPLVGLEAIDAVDWIEPATDQMKRNVVAIITRHRKSDVSSKLADLSIQTADDDCYKMRSLPRDDDCYKMRSLPRGPCVILNNVHFDKPMTKHDRHASTGANVRLTTLFEKMKFEVWSHADKTAEEIKEIFKDTGHDINDSVDIDCLVVFILSHGNKGLIFSKDLKPVYIKDIARHFTPDKCPALKGKPKLFFIDACRKPSKNFYSDLFSDDESDDEFDDHFFFGYAAHPNRSSHRNNETGDVYTEEFISVMGEKSDSYHLLEIMEEVNKRVSDRTVYDGKGKRKRQFPDMENKLTKKLYFR